MNTKVSIKYLVFLFCIIVPVSVLLSCKNDEPTIPEEPDPDPEPPISQGTPVFIEENGIVVIDLENLPEDYDKGDWLFKTTEVSYSSGTSFVTTGNERPFTGDGYLFFDGANAFRSPAGAILEYKVRINNPGVYRLLLKAAIGVEDPNSPGGEHNDVWVKFKELENNFPHVRTTTNLTEEQREENRAALEFYGLCQMNTYPENGGSDQMCNVTPRSQFDKSGSVTEAISVIVPGGTPNTNANHDQPAGDSQGGWFKLVNNNFGRWAYEAKTSDNDSHIILMNFKTSGDYTLQISGRSQGFCMDMAYIFKPEGAYAPSNTDRGNFTGRRNTFRDVPATTPIYE